MYKKWIALLLALTVFVGCLTSCTTQAPAEDPSQTTATTKPNKAAPVKKDHVDNPFLTEAEYAALISSRSQITPQVTFPLFINGVEAVYETERDCYFFSVDADNVWEALTPTVEGYTVVYKQQLAEGKKEKLLSSNEPVTIVAYDSIHYVHLPVIFTSLPVLSLETKKLPGEYNYFDKDEDYEVLYDSEGNEIPYMPYATPSDDPAKPIGDYDTFLSMTLLDADADQHGYENGFTSMARAHIRGRSSRKYPKNSYKLELLKDDGNGTLVERDETLLGMRNDGDWNLNGMYAEPTKVRDKVAADVWLAMTEDRDYEGVRNGYRCEYIEIIINGRYHGLYLMTERIDHKQLGLDDGDLLYFSEGDLGKHHNEYLKSDDTEDMEIGGYSLKWPKERTEPFEEWIPFGELTKLIQATNRETFESTAEEMVNIDSLVDYLVFVQSVVGVDNLIQNTFYVARQQEDGSYEFSFLPWDMDQTFGMRWSGEEPLLVMEDYWSLEYYEASFWISRPFVERGTASFNERVRERYTALRKTVLSDTELIKRFNAAQSALTDSGAWARNQERWPEGAYSSVSAARGFIMSRMSFVDSMYKN